MRRARGRPARRDRLTIVHVLATAGHVDHGKSTLVQALTGSDPDRLEEEHRRGLSIELGYCWTALPDGGECAFVDVPGHERFVPTMLAGVGPVPAVLFVVAADDDWMPQAAEHLAALDAFGVRHGVAAVTRSDLADPGPVLGRTRAELGRTGLADADVLAVSARTGDGLPALRHALSTMLEGLPAPDPGADVRLWVDRRFVVRGAGTVVTGTLQAGTIAVGDVLQHGREQVRVRGIQTLEREVGTASGVARVALRLGGKVPPGLARGGVLVTPHAWRATGVADICVTEGHPPPERPVLHIGAASAGAHFRPLGNGFARVSLEHDLPLVIGDRALLRDPGSGRIWGLRVLDPAPPALWRRGAARARADELSTVGEAPDAAAELVRRGCVRADLLRRIGVPLSDVGEVALQADGWLLDRRRVPGLARRLHELVDRHQRVHPLESGVPVSAAARELALPTPALVPPLVGEGLEVRDGRIVAHAGTTPALPAELERSLDRLREELRDRPFAAPDAARMHELGLHRRAVAAAAKAGLLLRVTDALVLLPGADRAAADLLRELPQPFTTSQARVHLGTTRRVVLPLLDLLDRQGRTVRLPDDRRTLNDADAPG